jgi:hypothetical protein
MNKKKIIGAIFIASSLILGVKGIRDVTFKSDVNLSTRSMFGEPNEIQMIFARNGQAYQDEIQSKGTIETVIAGVLFTIGIVVFLK